MIFLFHFTSHNQSLTPKSGSNMYIGHLVSNGSTVYMIVSLPFDISQFNKILCDSYQAYGLAASYDGEVTNKACNTLIIKTSYKIDFVGRCGICYLNFQN